jgi:hypothetical protein
MKQIPNVVTLNKMLFIIDTQKKSLKILWQKLIEQYF